MKPTWGLWYLPCPLHLSGSSNPRTLEISGVEGNSDCGFGPWLNPLSVPSSVCRLHSTWLWLLTSQKLLRHFWKLAVILNSETFEEIPHYTLPVSRAAWPVWESWLRAVGPSTSTLSCRPPTTMVRLPALLIRGQMTREGRGGPT